MRLRFLPLHIIFESFHFSTHRFRLYVLVKYVWIVLFMIYAFTSLGIMGKTFSPRGKVLVKYTPHDALMILLPFGNGPDLVNSFLVGDV